MGLDSPGTGYGAQTVSSVSSPSVGTICFWMRPTGLSGTQRVLAIADDFEGRFANGNELNHEWGYGGSGAIDVPVSNNTLYHIACVWEGPSTDDGAIYCDGSLHASGETGYNNTASGTLVMFDRAGSNDPWEGELYDIRIYNRVLSAAEILTIYNSRGGDSIVHGMLNRWMMDEGAVGSTLSGTGVSKDRGQNQNNWSSASGAPSYIYDVPVIPRRR